MDDPKITYLQPYLNQRNAEKASLVEEWQGAVTHCARIGGEEYALSLTQNDFTQTLDFLITSGTLRRGLKGADPETVLGCVVKVTSDKQSPTSLIDARRATKLLVIHRAPA